MNTSYYEDIFEDFKRRCSWVINEIDRWFPRGPHGISVILRNGERVDYNMVNQTMRFYGKLDESGDISDMQCRADFALKLRDHMDRLGFTHDTLAKYSGISVGSINAYMTKRSTPSLTNVRKLARALGCPVGELID